MKKNCLIVLILLPVLSNLSFAQNKAPGDSLKGSIEVAILGFETNNGQVKIALCNSEENYGSDTEPFRGASVPIVEKQAVTRFENIPFGEYAIKVFHDKNADDKLNTNFLGIPSEDYGFSNDARGTFGPPSFKEAKFEFNHAEMSVKINIK